MTKSARQLANLTAANWSTSANWRRPSANWRTSSPPTGEISQNDQVSPPTGQPRRRQLARSLKMTKSARQLVNLTAANWSTSSPPTGQPLPTGEPRRRQLARSLKMTKSARQLVNLTAANWRTSSPPTGEIPQNDQVQPATWRTSANWSDSAPRPVSRRAPQGPPFQACLGRPLGTPSALLCRHQLFAPSDKRWPANWRAGPVMQQDRGVQITKSDPPTGELGPPWKHPRAWPRKAPPAVAHRTHGSPPGPRRCRAR